MARGVRVIAVAIAAMLVVPAAAAGTEAQRMGQGGSPVGGASAGEARVIVQAPGAEAATADAVARLGGTVTRSLPIVSGFAATVPVHALSRLEATPGVRAVTPDAALHATSDPATDNLQPINSVFVREIGADVLRQRGHTGAGVRIALIDTGVGTAVATSGDLSGRIVPVADPATPPTRQRPVPPTVACVDFSGERTCDDTFGHGTFMAGLMAGTGAASGGRFAGVAPDAEIVSVKVGGADGSADVSKVLAGIQWVVSFADRYDIRVLSLSFGTDSTASPRVDPLNLAVQRAWVAGITVVVSAGNFGPGPRTTTDGRAFGTISKPGDDPFVITVGAVDDRETPGISDNRLPAFSSWGPTAHGVAKPDVVAPGGRVVSLRTPGSTIDSLPGVLDGTYRRGSGTSMAAAITSGLAALLLDARDGTDGRPAWRPDDVKAALIAGAQKVAFSEPRALGAGLVNGPAALEASIAPTYRTTVLSDGSGTLDGSRGGNRVDGEPCRRPQQRAAECGPVEGEETAQGRDWDGQDYVDSPWTPESWYSSQWVGRTAGHNWQTTTWAEGHNWQGHNWQGSWWNLQSDDRSYGTPIQGSGWYGAWG
jgi:serine protease AprX